MIEVNDLGKVFKNDKRPFWAVKNVNLCINKGEFIGIIGENGSGKTTLLKLICGILKPSEGQVVVGGSLVPLLEFGLGFQNDLTARENVSLYGSVLGLTKDDLDFKFNRIVEFSGLEDFIDMPLKNMSSGMQVRLAFSIAMETDSDILLVDEILAVGDENFQRKCLDRFIELKKKGRTVVFVSHDLVAVRRFCDKVILLEKGVVTSIGKPDEVIDYYLNQLNKKSLSQLDFVSLEIKKRDIEIERLKSFENIKPKRWGTKEVEITGVKLIDKSGAVTNDLRSGEPLRIVIEYKRNKNVGSAVFGIVIRSASNVHCYGTNTMLKHKHVELKDRGCVELYIKSLPLNYGKFLLSVNVHDESHYHYDWHDDMYEFNVKRVSNDEGLIAIEGEWKI